MAQFCNILSDFLSNRQQHVAIGGYFSNFTSVKSGVSQSNVLGPLLFIFHSSDMWHEICFLLMAYADDTF